MSKQGHWQVMKVRLRIVPLVSIGKVRLGGPEKKISKSRSQNVQYSQFNQFLSTIY